MAAGIFGLSGVYFKQVKDSTENTYSNWPEGATYGYCCGTGPPAAGSEKTQRLSLSTDTIQLIPAEAPNAKYGMVHFDTKDHGYFIAGNGSNPTANSYITKFDFSSESHADPGNFWPTYLYTAASFQNEDYGYSYTGGSSIIRRMEFSTETTQDLSNKATLKTSYSAGTESRTHGYSVGGRYWGPPWIEVSTIAKFDFSTEFASDSFGKFPSPDYFMQATESDSYAFLNLGSTQTVKLEFASDTCSLPGQTASSNCPVTAATVDHGVDRGYYLGGTGDSNYSSNENCKAFRLDFASESLNYLGQICPTAFRSGVGVSNKGSRHSILKGVKTYGYVLNGTKIQSAVPSYNNTSAIVRVDLSTGSVSASPSLIDSDRMSVKSVSSNQHGYIAGGDTPSSATNYISRIDFATEVISSPGINMNKKRTNNGSVSTSDYGYYVGGAESTYTSNIDRHDFATEVVTVSSPHNQVAIPSLAPYFNLGGVSDNNYGYFCGGKVNGNKSSSIQKLDFSNDIISNPATKFPATGINDAFKLENNSNAYFTKENPAAPTLKTSNVFKLQFSNETTSETAIELPDHVGNGAGISAEYIGYLCGGKNNAPGGAGNPNELDSILQIDFATETGSDTGNSLPSEVHHCSGMENASGSGC